jgi:outer membrane lipoprotein
MDLLINKIIQADGDTALLPSLPATSEMFLQGVQKHAKQEARRYTIMKRIFILFAAVLMLSSCAHAISEQYRETARKGISFSQILKDPDTYMNGVFIFGGTIVQTTHTKEGSEIEVIENPLDRYGDISDKDISEGRLILVTSRQLDPLIYKDGRTITFAGKLIGTREKMLAGTQYRYPVFEAKELHLWKPAMHYYTPYPWWYDPFYYPYWYGPPFYRPYLYPYW